MSASLAANQIQAEIANGHALRPVLSRLIGACAARADLPVDRLNDTLLVSDAIAASQAAFSDGVVCVSATIARGSLELRIGPLSDEGAAQLSSGSALPSAGGLMARVADQLRIERDGAASWITLHFGS